MSGINFLVGAFVFAACLALLGVIHKRYNWALSAGLFIIAMLNLMGGQYILFFINFFLAGFSAPGEFWAAVRKVQRDET